MVKLSKSYFFQTFLIIMLSIVFFVGIKSVLPNKIFSTRSEGTRNVVVDSLLLEAITGDYKNTTVIDTVSKDTISKQLVRGDVFTQIKDTNFQDYKGFEHLSSFYEKLDQLESNRDNKVRIAYFGDSMTDGDLIVQDLRASYQRIYGGTGVGFVSIMSESAGSRGTIKHQFSNNWNMQSYLNVKKPISPFGVNGYVFFTKDKKKGDPWVRYKANTTEFATMLDNATLFYGVGNNKDALIAFDIDKDTIQLVKKLEPYNLLNTLSIPSRSVKGFKANFINADSIPIYGFNFDNGKGIHIDNFSNRGNSGLPISLFNKNLMKAFDEKLQYDLIVLHYGANVINYGTTNYSWYDKGMSKVIKHLKECFPNAAILVISSADKSTKIAMTMQTDPAVEPLVKAQRKSALRTRSGFIDLYSLMGGAGTMVTWVEQEPPLASKDYTHFNARGAKKIAGLLYNELEKGYMTYKKMKSTAKRIDHNTVEQEYKPHAK